MREISRRFLPVVIVATAITFTVILQGCSDPEPTPTPSVPNEPVVTSFDRVVTVTRVIDGDTVDVCCPEERIRLLGIDSPESDEPLFDEAKALAEQLADGQSVRLEKCIEEADQYGRLLRHIFVDETHVNREMVSAGLATAYEFSLNLNPCYVTELRGDQDAAQSAGLGMWE